MLISNAVRRLIDQLAGTIGALSLESRLLARFGRGSTADLPRFMASAAAYRLDLRKPLVAATMGCSLGNGPTLTRPELDAPGNYFTRRLKALFDPADRFNIQNVNFSVDGSTVSGFPAAWAALVAAGYKPSIVQFVFGVNDAQVAQFNSGQTYDGFSPALRRAVSTAINAGADVVLYTAPHAAIVNHGNALYQMPAGIPQNYPVDQNTPAIPAPVSPEQLSPPKSKSSKSVDYLGDGVMITLDVRMLCINDAIRAVGRELGVLVIEADKTYMEALQEATARLGSPALAETEFYNPGESLHPNDNGIKSSYHRAIDEFLLSFCHQLSQGATEKTGGYGGMNVPVRGRAAWEVRPPRGDITTKPISFWANTGAIQAGGDGLNEAQEWMQIDPATGDMVHGANANRWRAPMTSAGIVTEIEHIRTAYGVRARSKILGSPNMVIATPWTIGNLPDNGAGRLMISAQNGGIVSGPQVNFYRWTSKGGALTLVADGANIGSGVFSAIAVGLGVRITVIADNTPVQVEWQSLTVG